MFIINKFIYKEMDHFDLLAYFRIVKVYEFWCSILYIQ